MTKAIMTTPGLADSIKSHIEILKKSSDPAARETASAMEAQFDVLIERVMQTINLARNQRDAAFMEQAEVLAAVELLYPGFTRTALLVASMPREELAG